MKHTFLILLIVTLLVSSCCINKITESEKEYWNKEVYGEEPFFKNKIPPKKITLKEFYDNDGYIFPKEYNSGWEKKFTPTLEDIIKAELLFNRIHDSLSQFKNINFKRRYRQYLGYYDRDNRKIINANFIKLKKSCKNVSSTGFLIDKWFIQVSHNPKLDEILWDRVFID